MTATRLPTRFVTGLAPSTLRRGSTSNQLETATQFTQLDHLGNGGLATLQRQLVLWSPGELR